MISHSLKIIEFPHHSFEEYIFQQTYMVAQVSEWSLRDEEKFVNHFASIGKFVSTIKNTIQLETL